MNPTAAKDSDNANDNGLADIEKAVLCTVNSDAHEEQRGGYRKRYGILSSFTITRSSAR